MPRSYRSGFVTGVAVSLGAALLSPALRPVLARWGRPALKAVTKGGLIAYAAARERAAEFGETVSDVLAEAQFELATEQAAGSARQEGAAEDAAPQADAAS